LYFLKISLPLYVSRIIIRNKKVHDFTIQFLSMAVFEPFIFLFRDEIC